MRNSFLAIVGVFSSIVLGFWIVDRPAHTSSAHFDAENAPVPMILPAGTDLRIRLNDSISQGSKPGDALQGVVADGIVMNSQVFIPANARASIKVTNIHDHRGSDLADVTLELNELSSPNAHLQMHALPIKTTLKRLSDMDVLAEGIAGMVGGALGAAGSASLGQNPGVGAAAGVDGLTNEAEILQQEQTVLLFKTTEPIDLTRIIW